MKRIMMPLIALMGALIGCPGEFDNEKVPVNPRPKVEATKPEDEVTQPKDEAAKEKPKPEETRPDETPLLQATEPKQVDEATKEKPKPKVKISSSEDPESDSKSKMDPLPEWLLEVQRRKGWVTERKANNTNAQIRGLCLTDKAVLLATPTHFATTTVKGPVDKVFLQLFGAEPLEMERTLIGKSEGFEVWKVDRPEYLKRFQFTFIFTNKKGQEVTEWG